MPDFNPIADVDCKYGAPFGRPCRPNAYTESLPQDPLKLYLQRVHINSGGYDAGGAYWGLGQRLYTAFDADGTFCRFLRANSRDAAKRSICNDYPEATFYR
jgi:hypothetical protein